MLREGLGRGRVAGQYDQRASLFEKMFDGFESESVDELERARAVWCARIVAKIQIVVLRQPVADVAQYGKAPESGIEHPYRPCLLIFPLSIL